MMVSACLALHLLVVPEADYDLQSLVKRHQRYLEGIETLDVQVRADASEDGGRTWTSDAVIRWRMDRKRRLHRFTSVFHGKLAKGQNAFQDYCFGPDGSRFVEYPDAPLPEALGPANDYGRVWAQIDGGGPGFGPRVACYWLFLWGAGRSSTLADSLQAASRKKLLGKVIMDGHELWGIEMEEPQYKATYTFYLDAARNYAIVRREVRTPADLSVHRVLDSKEFQPGIFLPTHVQNRAMEESVVINIRLLSAKVNEPLAEEAFEVPFPSGARVHNAKTGEIYIWGDGAPARVFADQREVRQW